MYTFNEKIEVVLEAKKYKKLKKNPTTILENKDDITRSKHTPHLVNLYIDHFIEIIRDSLT